MTQKKNTFKPEQVRKIRLGFFLTCFRFLTILMVSDNWHIKKLEPPPSPSLLPSVQQGKVRLRKTPHPPQITHDHSTLVTAREG